MQHLRILHKYVFAHLFVLLGFFFLPLSRFLLICLLIGVCGGFVFLCFAYFLE